MPSRVRYAKLGNICQAGQETELSESDTLRYEGLETYRGGPNMGTEFRKNYVNFVRFIE